MPSAAPIVAPSANLTQGEIRAAAAKGYLAAVQPANKAFKTLYKKYKNKTSLRANRAYCRELANVTRTMILALREITFPEDTKPDVKSLIKHDASSEANLRTCARATSWTIWNRAWALQSKANDRAHEAANLVRIDLGLKPVPG